MSSIYPKLDSTQFGNWKGYSTTHCLIHVFHYLVSGAKKSNNVGTLILTDFSQAFDTIYHQFAINRLIELDVSPSIVKWIVSCLTERQQRVKYKNTFSGWQTLWGGVPQGTKLGTVIFLACIYSALESSKNRCWKYVDDLTLGENRLLGHESNLQSELNELTSWAEDNGFSLNPTKCQTLQVYFGRRSIVQPSFVISNTRLQCVPNVKLLGVTLQNNFKWDIVAKN